METKWKNKVFVVSSVMAGLLMLSVPMFGHHGTNISYDSSKPVTLKGTVTDFRYANPHPQVFFDVTDDAGKVVHWAGEVAPTPFTLQQSGWGKSRSLEALKSGTKITITLGPSRAGAPIGVVLKILNDEGEELLNARNVD